MEKEDIKEAVKAAMSERWKEEAEESGYFSSTYDTIETGYILYSSNGKKYAYPAEEKAFMLMSIREDFEKWFNKQLEMKGK